MKVEKFDNIDFELPKDFYMKFIENDLKFKVYKIRYTYKTIRNNPRENYKYLISNDEIDVKFKFLEFIEKFNKKYKHRSISNVKILDVELLGTVTK
ncbi:hypothetical protein [Terrisporobacter petrolearius]|uniref:hypothetical protein n=1 Tax=Terrisporobacter petrolearius TaxID=1460447 RepID=UPI003AFF7007